MQLPESNLMEGGRRVLPLPQNGTTDRSIFKDDVKNVSNDTQDIACKTIIGHNDSFLRW